MNRGLVVLENFRGDRDQPCRAHQAVAAHEVELRLARIPARHGSRAHAEKGGELLVVEPQGVLEGEGRGNGQPRADLLHPFADGGGIACECLAATEDLDDRGHKNARLLPFVSLLYAVCPGERPPMKSHRLLLAALCAIAMPLFAAQPVVTAIVNATVVHPEREGAAAV